MSKDLPRRFTDSNAARDHLERLQWPDGPVCPHCGTINRASSIKGGRAGLWFCNACREQFTVTVGTVFERSKVPLHTWLYATHLICSSKKGISSNQIARMCGVTVKTAWFMSHRIREAMNPKAGSEPPLGGDGLIVEADETEITPSRKTWKARSRAKNMKFVTLVERDGRVRSRRITGKGTPIGVEIMNAIYENMDRASTLHTDGAQHYKLVMPMGQKLVMPMGQHEAVDHNKQFARDGKTGRVHTNTTEGFFSIFKRGLVGTYQHMSEQHLPRYLAEFDFRMNNRIALGIDDEMRADNALKGISGKRLTYRRTNEAAHP